jgi:hypothetical protein
MLIPQRKGVHVRISANITPDGTFPGIFIPPEDYINQTQQTQYNAFNFDTEGFFHTDRVHHAY